MSHCDSCSLPASGLMLALGLESGIAGVVVESVTPAILWLEAACSPLGLRLASLEAVVESVASLTRQEGSAPARDLVPNS